MSNLGIRISPLALNNIDLTDTRYRISRQEGDITALALSIQQTGLTSPPLVRPLGNSYIVVAGFKRINALVHNKFTGQVVCQINPRASEADSAVSAVSDNAFQRQLTPAELIQSVLLLGRFMEPDQIAQKSLAIFNSHLNPGYIKDLQKIGTLPQQALELLDDGRLSIASAKKISGYDPGLAQCFVSLFSAVKASSSKQMEIITHFFEIAARENTRPVDLYRESKIQAILVHDSKDLGLKCNLLRSYLTQRRFPLLEKKRREIQKNIHALKLTSGMRLMVPESFESMIYSLCFDFKNKTQFQEQISFLRQISQNPALEEILNR
ncbi:MAG: ParB N-terminal domain-containing protein [Proteobacteria bacterium]|nr:ParB N-terminal domain-containing protein [Pseudomonadota bacterium]